MWSLLGFKSFKIPISILSLTVMGEFFPPGRYQDPPIKLNPTIGRNYVIKCPPHISGYGTKIKWGTVNENFFTPSYFKAGRPHKGGFPMSGARFAFSYVTRDDFILSKDVGGMRCIMVNFGFIVASAQMVLWQPYKSELFFIARYIWDGKEYCSWLALERSLLSQTLSMSYWFHRFSFSLSSHIPDF